MIIPSGFAQITYLFNGACTPLGAACTIGVDLGSVTDLADVADAAQIAFNSALGDHISGDAEGTTIRVKAGPNSTGLGADFTRPFSGAGSGTVVSPQVTFLLKKRTSDGGRAGRGRLYLPGVDEGQVDGTGALTSGTITAIQSDCDDFYDSLIAAGLLPVVFHGAGSPLSTPSVIQAIELDGRVATQRRRLRR